MSLPSAMPYLAETLTFLLACVFSGVLTAVLIRLAPRLGLLDAPGPRKVHQRVTPRGGGSAIYLAVLLGLACIRPSMLVERTGLLLLGLGGLIALVGLIDDWRSLPWQVRLSAQFVAALVAVAFGFPPSHWLVQGLAVLWIVGMTNAFNMLDNMDMLSAGTAWVAAAALAVVSAASSGERLIFCLLLLGALSGFLWFNRPPARIFMGDVGSNFLGFVLAVLSLEVIWPADQLPGALFPLILLAVACYDMTTVILIRLRQGRSPFHADKQHLSHRLVNTGLASPVAVAIIHALALASGLAAVLLVGVTEWWVVGVFVAGWLVVLGSDVVMTTRRKQGAAP